MKLVFAQTTESVNQELTSNMEKLLRWAGSQVNIVLDIAVIVIIAIVVIHVLSGVINNLLKRAVRKDMYPSATDRDKRLKTLRGIFNAVIRFTVWIIAGFMILDAMGINTAPLIASAGILGVALGFGTQSLVKDFVSGLFIIVENQYRVGDYIEVQNVSGTVEDISMRTTILRDIDGSVHTVPNGAIIVSTNRTKGVGHAVMDLTIDNDDDMQTVESTINSVGQAMMKDPEFGEMLVEPPQFLRISEFGDKGVTVQVSTTTASGKQKEVKAELLKRLEEKFKAKNIKIISTAVSKPKKK